MPFGSLINKWSQYEWILCGNQMEKKAIPLYLIKNSFCKWYCILSHYHDSKNDFSKRFPQCRQMKKKMNLIKFSFHYLQREEVSLDIMFLSCSVAIKSGCKLEMVPNEVLISFNKTWKESLSISLMVQDNIQALFKSKVDKWRGWILLQQEKPHEIHVSQYTPFQ